MLSEELGVSKAFLARWYIGGRYMDISEVVLFMIVAKFSPDIGRILVYCNVS